MLLQVVGVSVPLMAGLIFRALLWGVDPSRQGTFVGLDPIVMVSVILGTGFISSFICGLLLRSWWAAVEAPAAFLAGIVLWDVVALVVESEGAFYWGAVLEGEAGTLGWYVGSAAVGAAIGTILSLQHAGRPRSPHDTMNTA